MNNDDLGTHDNPRRLGRVCVFCGSRAGHESVWLETAHTTGQILAERGLTLVYGGGGRGMMGAVADATLAAGGKVIGVIPSELFAREHLHPGIDELREVPDLLERKRTMAALSDGFLVLPGGLGTLDELFEMWTWLQLGIHQKPLAIVNVRGYFDPLLQYLDAVVANGYLDRSGRALLIDASTPKAALERLLSWSRADPG